MAPKKKSTRGLGFSQQEVFALLDIIEEHCPVAQDDWDLIAADHAALYPDSKRNSESLRRKFVSLYRKKTPTGDPKCPPDVRRAKFILEQIKKSVDLSEGEEGQVLGDEEEEEQEDGQSSAADSNRDTEANRHTGTAIDGDFDGDGNILSGGEDDEEEGEKMSSRDANNSSPNDIVARSTTNQVDITAMRVSTAAARTAASVGGSSIGSRSSNVGGHAATSNGGNLNTSSSTSSTTFGSATTSSRISRTGSKRAGRPVDNDDDISMQQLMKKSFMQGEQDRADRQAEERLRCDEMRQNQQFLQQIMMTMMFAMGKNAAMSNRNQENATSSSNKNKEQHDDVEDGRQP